MRELPQSREVMVRVRPRVPRSAARTVQTARSVWRFLRGDGYAMTGAVIYFVMFVVAIFAPVLAPHNPQQMLTVGGSLASNMHPGAFFLGTTNMGRDIFSQLLYGTRPTLIVGFLAAFSVVVIGTIVGLIAGFFGGGIDEVLMRITDLAFGIPFIPFVIVLVAFLGPSIWNVVMAMAMLLWRDTARVIRSQVMTLRARSFVEAARLSGASELRILFLHVAPNVLPLSFLYGSLAIGWAILTQAAVSFLGFGDPTVMSWGYMLQDAYVSQALARGAFYWFVPPGICIMLAVMAGFFISRGVEEVLYPRLRRK